MHMVVIADRIGRSPREYDIKQTDQLEQLKHQLDELAPHTGKWLRQASYIALVLLSRYEQINHVQYREEFVKAINNILTAPIVSEDPRWARAELLQTCATRLQACYRRRAVLEDVMLAIRLHEHVLKIAPVESFLLHVTPRINAAACYIDSTSITEDDGVLEIAMDLLDEASRLCQASDQPLAAICEIQISLFKADLLSIRYERGHALENLDAAIKQREHTWVILSTYSEDPEIVIMSEENRVDILCKLAALYEQRSERSDSEEQKRCYRALCEKYADELLENIRNCTQPDPLLHDWMFFGILPFLSDKAREEITKDDIDQARSRFEIALEEIPDDDSRKFMYLGAYATMASDNSLALSNTGRKGQYGDQNFKQRSQIIQKCLRLLPKGILDYKSQFLVNFGQIYFEELAGDMMSEADLGTALDLFRDAAVCQDARPSVRIQGARVAATILVFKKDWIQAADLFETAIGLIQSLSPASLSPSDQQFVLKAISGLSSEAAATALQAKRSLHRALLLLELGSGVMARLQMQTRRRGVGGDENLLNAQLNSGVNFDPGSLLLGEPFGQNDSVLSERVMRVIGDEAVVVINVSDRRSDAFLITKRGMSLIRLLQMQKTKLRRAALLQKAHRPRIWVSTLSLLWFYVAKPILDSAEFVASTVPGKRRRVCWILNGELSTLPIHAAGDYRYSGTSVMDRVVSSYSSSVTAFINRKTKQENYMHLGRALLVGVPNPSSHNLAELRYVAKELAVLRALCDRPQFGLSSLEVGKNEEEEVLSALKDVNVTVFHFAGHGFLHPSNPSESGLLLQDGGVLTVAKLRDSELNPEHHNPPFLAYLSACSTGASDAKGLIDEGIHLIGACQLIGFRHVIGTMWQASDSRCVFIAKTVYETIAKRGWTDDSVAEALHGALLNARANWIQNVLHPAMFDMAWQVQNRHEKSSSANTGGSASIITLGSFTRLMNPEDVSEDEMKMIMQVFPGLVVQRQRGMNHSLFRDQTASASESENVETLERNVRRDFVAEEYELGERPEDVVVRADWIPFVHYGP